MSQNIQLPDGRIYWLDSRKIELLNFYKSATLKYNTSAVVIYDGRSGMGKSTSAIQDGFYCDISKSGFGLHKIYFTPEEFLDGLANAEPYSFHLYDEAMVLSNRASMSRLNMTIVKAMSMIRSKKIIVAFCINSIFDLDRNLTLSRADALFHHYGKNIIQRGKFAAFFKGRDGQDRLKQLYLFGKKYYTYNKPRANFIGTFGRRFLVDPEEYEAKKQLGVTASLQEKKKSRKEIYLEEIIWHLKYKKGIPVEELAEMGKVPVKTLYSYLLKINERKVATQK